MSENSSARTCVIDADNADSISGNRSVMPPGWMPVPCSVASPSAHAASIVGGRRPVGVEPADRCRRRSCRIAGSGRRPRGRRATARRRRSRRRSRAPRRRRSSRRRRSASRPISSPTSLPVLGVGVHPAPDQLEVGMAEDAFDRGRADAAGRPLDHTNRSLPQGCPPPFLRASPPQRVGGERRNCVCTPPLTGAVIAARWARRRRSRRPTRSCSGTGRGRGHTPRSEFGPGVSHGHRDGNGGP